MACFILKIIHRETGAIQQLRLNRRLFVSKARVMNSIIHIYALSGRKPLPRPVYFIVGKLFKKDQISKKFSDTVISLLSFVLKRHSG